MSLVRLLVLFLALPGFAWSATVTIPASPQQRGEVIDLSGDIEVFHDPSGELDITEVSRLREQGAFQRNRARRSDFGYIRGNLWMYMELLPETAVSRYLVSDFPVVEGTGLFLRDREQIRRCGEAHDCRVLDSYRTPAWHLNLPGGRPVALFLRASNGQEALHLMPRLMDESAFSSHSIHRYVFFSSIMAGLLVLALYNLSLAYGLKDASYFFLGLLGIGLMLISYRDSNLLPSLRFLSSPHSPLYTGLLMFTAVVAMRFWRYVNEGGSKLLDGVMRGIQWSMLALLPFSALIPVAYLYWLLAIMIPVLLVLITRVMLDGHAATRSAYPAALMLSVSAEIYSVIHLESALGWSLGTLPSYIGQAGYLLSSLLLSISHAGRARQLRDAMEREAARSQAMDEFLVTMSHELRTPMNAVISASTLLRETRLDARQKLYLDHQETAARHMIELIGDILDLSKLDSRRSEQARRPFCLCDVLKRVEQIVRPGASAKGLELKFPATAEKKSLMGHPQHLSQVLINLIGNAIKFTPHGTVELIVRCETAEQEGLEKLYFEVRDTGIGIPEEARSRIFQPFSQVSSQRSREYGGSGMGLAISQRLVAAMGGTLEFESREFLGTRFFFTLALPRYAAPCPVDEPADSRALPPAGAFDGRQILVVEDDPLNQFFVAELLKRRGMSVSLAGSGEEAISMLREKGFDLVLMDVSMPGMDGYETTRRIRALPGLGALPIIALTAHSIAGERERCLAAGMDAYLTKPIDVRALEAALQRWLRPREPSAKAG